MALSDEQNAMLRLLARGEQGYTDIAALMGLSEEEVRAKVVGALAQLQAEGKPAPDVPPPVPRAAEPVEEAPAAEEVEPAIAESVAPRTAAEDPAPPKPAASEPRATAPAPKPDKLTATPPVSPPPSGRPPSGGRTITLPSGRNAWLLGGGIVAAIVVIAIVIILISGGGGGGSSTASNEAPSATAEEGRSESTVASKQSTQAELTAVDGSEAAGRATFGRVKNKLALQIEATGLEPTVKGTNSYSIWLAQSPQKMLPLALGVAVKGSGKGADEIAAQFEVPVEVLGYLANGTFDQIAITRTDDKQLEAALQVATKKKQAPAYTGEAVLRGTITGPIVGIATREEEAKKAEEKGE